MSVKQFFWLCLLCTLVLALNACTPAATPTPEANMVGIANPAAVHCKEQGGQLETRTDSTGGQYGVCIFADGSECEEWAFFRGECQPGQSKTAPSPQAQPAYTNEQYGFSFNPPGEWAIEGYEHHLIFRQGEYFLFVGFKRANEEVPPFRTGMPAGDFVDGGTASFLGEPINKKLLVFEGKNKVVDYQAPLAAGDLQLYVWLDVQPAQGADYAAIDIPAEIINQADQIVASFALVSR
ncbi:MAG: DUF333 domain-containing protein [Chloroflexota bacterium]